MGHATEVWRYAQRITRQVEHLQRIEITHQARAMFSQLQAVVVQLQRSELLHVANYRRQLGHFGPSDAQAVQLVKVFEKQCTGMPTPFDIRQHQFLDMVEASFYGGQIHPIEVVPGQANVQLAPGLTAPAAFDLFAHTPLLAVRGQGPRPLSLRPDFQGFFQGAVLQLTAAQLAPHVFPQRFNERRDLLVAEGWKQAPYPLRRGAEHIPRRP